VVRILPLVSGESGTNGPVIRKRSELVAILVAVLADVQAFTVHLVGTLKNAWWDFEALRQIAGVSSSTLV
jgi:hypothetical protein